MGDKVSDTLRQLGASFTVRDIMVPCEDFVLIDSESKAQCFFDKYEDFDYTASRKGARSPPTISGVSQKASISGKRTS